jgi:hypothetical protein
MNERAPGPALVVLAAGRARRYGGCKPLAPVGIGGEAVIDLLAGDALAAGFSTIILVVGPSTGPAIRYHVEHRWPAGVDVRFAHQETPLGTVHAVLAAEEHLAEGVAFGVANADDLYGADALALLAPRLAEPAGANTVVAFRLRNAVVGDSPVTRGVCRVDEGGRLTSIDERRKVVAVGGGRFRSEDGLEPSELDGDALVSMNLWGFGPAIRVAFRAAMDEAEHASADAEVLLPDVVGRVLRGERPGGVPEPPPFRVLAAPGRCIGVTHPEDLALVRADVAREVGGGDRPAHPWAPGGPGPR